MVHFLQNPRAALLPAIRPSVGWSGLLVRVVTPQWWPTQESEWVPSSHLLLYCTCMAMITSSSGALMMWAVSSVLMLQLQMCFAGIPVADQCIFTGDGKPISTLSIDGTQPVCVLDGMRFGLTFFSMYQLTSKTLAWGWTEQFSSCAVPLLTIAYMNANMTTTSWFANLTVPEVAQSCENSCVTCYCVLWPWKAGIVEDCLQRRIPPLLTSRVRWPWKWLCIWDCNLRAWCKFHLQGHLKVMHS